jgi:uncharacterized membrane protein
MTMILFKVGDAHVRSLAKAVTWRLAASVDTLFISYLITGRITLAGTIAGAELLTKLVIYYLHERVWATVPWGSVQGISNPSNPP